MKKKTRIVCIIMVMVMLVCSIPVTAYAQTSTENWNLHYALNANASDNVVIKRLYVTYDQNTTGTKFMHFSHSFSVNKNSGVNTNPALSITSSKFNTVTLNSTTRSINRQLSDQNASTVSFTVKFTGHTGHNFVSSIGSGYGDNLS